MGVESTMLFVGRGTVRGIVVAVPLVLLVVLLCLVIMLAIAMPDRRRRSAEKSIRLVADLIMALGSGTFLGQNSGFPCPRAGAEQSLGPHEVSRAEDRNSDACKQRVVAAQERWQGGSPRR